MFRHRTNSQKPAHGLYAAFRESFPEFRALPATATSGEISFGDSLVYTTLNLPRIPSHSHKHVSGQDFTPRVFHESWKRTPPLHDPNYTSFAPLSNRPPVCTPPTLEWLSTPYYNEDVDPGTPEIEVEIGVRPPLLLPILGNEVYPGTMPHRQCYSPQIVQPPELYHSNHFDPSQSLAPCYVLDQLLDFDPLDNAAETPPICEGQREPNVHINSPVMEVSRPLNDRMPAPLEPVAEKFRFRTTLNAATSMVHKVDELPVTYLNKGNTYSMIIIDTAPTMPRSTPVQYRTSIRISFENGQQGQISATRWNFWKEGRGTAEFHQRGRKMQGVEYVESEVITENDSRTKAKLETASLDGFSVLWTRELGDSADCRIAVRFNFLSTDFSHSKGVKGIPSRLCAKTEIVSTDSLNLSSQVPEICFCEVNVFRDHGAERKLANDIASVKKTMDKLKQQILQAETRIRDSRKRKRNGSTAEKIMRNGTAKDLKHKKTRLMSSACTTEEDTYIKLQMLQNMLSSTQLVSLLNIRGQQQDDPGLHLIELTDGHLDLTNANLKERLQERTTGQQMIGSRGFCVDGSSTLVSILPSSSSTLSQKVSSSGYDYLEGAVLPAHGQWSKFQPVAPSDNLQKANDQQLQSPRDQPMEIQVLQQDSPCTPDKWIKPCQVACFYILYPERQHLAAKEYYQAVYIMKSEVKELIAKIAPKCNFNSTSILQIVDGKQHKLNIKADDSAVYELPEGQDMVLDLSRITALTVSRKWNKITDANFNGEDARALENAIQSQGYLLKLLL